MSGNRKKITKKTLKPGKEIVETDADEFKDKLVKAIGQDIRELVIDFKNVKTVDSRGVGVLIAARNSVDQKDCKLNLINVHENMFSLLQVLKLDGFLNASPA